MNKIILLLVLNFIALNIVAQDDIQLDSSEFTPMFERDTAARVHIGMKVGSFIQGINYQDNTEGLYPDSINNWGSDNHIGFLFGINLDIKINPKLSLQTGMDIAISKISLGADIGDTRLDGSTNYSTLQIPAWLSFAPKPKPNHIHYSGGLIAAFDISKRDERIGRLIQLNTFNLLLGVGMGYRVQLPSKANLNFDLQLHYGVLNMVAKDDNFYNNSLKSMNIWEVALYISMN